jgi:predicted transcriptional regulator
VNTGPVTRAELHGLVDEIPDERLESVAALLVEIVEDDETLTADDLAGLAESQRDVAAGRLRPAEDVFGELGI